MLMFERLGSEFTEFTPERVVMRTPVCAEMLQPDGILHGGISAYLAETAANHAAQQGVDLEQYCVVGLDLVSTHLLPVMEGDVIESVVTPARRGGKIQVWKVEQHRASDGELFNVSQLTTYTKRLR